MTNRMCAILILVAISTIPAGCGSDGGSSGPSSSQVLLVQQSTNASGALSTVFAAADAGIVASSNSGASTSGTTTSFNYSASVDLTIDFDALDADGNDPYPNATGRVHVAAEGTVTGTEQSGQAAYSVMVETESDVVLANPDAGVEVTIPLGASWSYALEIVWNVTDSENWQVTATAMADLDMVGVVVDNGSAVVTVDVQGNREGVATATRANGQLTLELSLEASLTITVDDGTTEETVTITCAKSGQVTITVQGGTFGPMSKAEAEAMFQTTFN